MPCIRLRHLIAALLPLLLMACSTIAPTSGAPPAPTPKAATDQVVLGVSFDILNNIRQAEKVAIMAKAQELGAVVEFVVADGDAQRQVTQIEELIAKSVDAIIAIPQDKDVIGTGVAKAYAAGIPFITLDREASVTKQVLFHVGADPYSDGRMAAQYMAYTAAATKRPLSVLVLVGGLADVNAVERNRGFTEELANWPDTTIVNTVQTEWQPDKAAAGTATTLAEHPDLNAIFSPSDYLLPAILGSLEEGGVQPSASGTSSMLIVSIDGDPFGYSKTRAGVVAANVATLADVMAARATEVAVLAVRGQAPTSNKEIIPGLLFSYSNAEAVAPKIWGAQTQP